MVTKSYEFYHRESGSWGEHDEYWTLEIPGEGRPFVEYRASWGNPYRATVKHDDPVRTPLKVFWNDQKFGVLRDRLDSLLNRLGVDPNAPTAQDRARDAKP
jgi:hypothetical protein